MHYFITSAAELVAFAIGMTLLVAWLTYVKTVRLKASLLDLAQNDSPSSPNQANIEAKFSSDSARSAGLLADAPRLPQQRG
jgi:hypothetical protein